jgi:GDPmannose 4,6-dehydratase
LTKTNKTAFITGISGQDGSYLAELLLAKGYTVHGLIRRSSHPNTHRIEHILNKLNLHYGDVTDSSCLNVLISKIKPDEVYNLAAQSHVQISFELPNYTGQVDALGTLNVLEAVRNNSLKTKIYQASTSELYGGLDFNLPSDGYNETSCFHPRSPYGAAKIYAYWICINYREAYNMFICNGILFNHGSPRRGINFIEKKIVDALVNIKFGKQDSLNIGNLYAKRDIGYAKEYVEGMYLMLQKENPDDYVLSTNETYTIKEMINISATYLNIDIQWLGSGINEIAIDKKTGSTIVKIDEKYLRPSEVDMLVGNSSKAKRELNWEAKTKLPDLLMLMIDEKIKET